MIKISVHNESPVKINIELKKPIQMKVRVDYVTMSYDYNSLANLPTLNGRPFVGDMAEEDPTVPLWAKEKEKPQYSADEVNAINADDSISIEYLASLLT